MNKRSWYLRILNTVCALLILCFAFGLSISFADTKNTDPSYQSLMQTLDKVQQENPVRYTFTQEKKIAALSRPLISEGFMIYDKNNGMYMEYTSPVWTAYLLIGDDIFEKLQNGASYQKISLPKGTNIGRILKSIIAADIESLSKYFNLKFSQEEELWTLKFEPRNSSTLRSLSEIELTGQRYFKKLVLREKNGDGTYLMFDPARSENKELSSQESKYFIH